MQVHPSHRGYVISGVGHSEYILVGCALAHKGGLMCGHNPKGGGVLGTCTVRKSEFLGTYLVQREGIRNWSCTKVSPCELIYHLSRTFICQYDLQSKKMGFRNGHNQKKGVLVAGASLKGGGVLGAGQVTRGAFTAAHTCTGHICESPI